MSWRLVRISAFAFFLVGAASAQDVEIVREKKPVPAKPEAATKQANLHADKTDGNAGPLVETKKPKPIKSEAAQSIPLIAKQPAKVDASPKVATKPKEDRSASANQPS